MARHFNVRPIDCLRFVYRRRAGRLGRCVAYRCRDCNWRNPNSYLKCTFCAFQIRIRGLFRPVCFSPPRSAHFRPRAIKPDLLTGACHPSLQTRHCPTFIVPKVSTLCQMLSLSCNRLSSSLRPRLRPFTRPLVFFSFLNQFWKSHLLTTTPITMVLRKVLISALPAPFFISYLR